MKKIAYAAAIAVVGLGLAGCDKLTKANYQKMEIGMSYADAVKLLGEPTECDAVVNTRSCTWTKDSKKINAKIIGESIVFKSAEGLE